MNVLNKFLSKSLRLQDQKEIFGGQFSACDCVSGYGQGWCYTGTCGSEKWYSQGADCSCGSRPIYEPSWDNWGGNCGEYGRCIKCN